MPLPDNNYQALFPLQEIILSKDSGLPLANGIVTFYRDSPRVPHPPYPELKPIYQQVQLPDSTYEFVELPNPLTLSSIGSFVDDNGTQIIPYLWPYTGTPADPGGAIDLYYITVYAAAPPLGDSSLQFTREAWPPNVTSGGQVRSFQSPTNELSNPQFSVVSFYPTSGYTFSVSAAGEVTNIAPDWDIVTTGTGTVTVAQVAVTDSSAPSHPPYAIQISSTGIDSLHLRQRLRVTSRLLLNSFVSGTFVAQAMANPPAIISLNYMPSTSSTPTLFQQICEGTAIVGTYTTIANSEAVEIGLINSDSAPSGYVDIYLDIPPSTNVQISSVQIVAVENSDSSTVYMQQSNEREIDHLFHYYNLPLQQKPIDSYLVGWDFAMNPAQLGSTFGAQAIGANKSFYCWDQTIVFQSVDSGVTIAREASANLLNVTAALTGQIALIQYLSQEQAKKVLFQLVYGGSVNVSIACSTGSVNCMATLWWKGTSVGIGMATNDSLVSALASDGFPTATGWTEITRTNTPRATFTVSSSSLTDFGFSGFQAGAAYSTGVAFAIVLSTGSVPAGTILTVASISLVPGNIPTRPAYKSISETINECSYYYQKSFAQGVTPGQGTGVGTGETYFTQAVAGATAGTVGSAVRFPVKMRASPTVVAYNPFSANAFIRNLSSNSDYTVTSPSATSTGLFMTGTPPGGSVAGSLTGVHWTADARLGVIA